MNAVDIIIIVIAVMSAFLGLKCGFIPTAFVIFVGMILCAAILDAVAKAGVAEEAISHSHIAELPMKRFPLLLGLLRGEFDFLKTLFD